MDQEKFTDWNMRQDELEESVFSRLDELSESLGALLKPRG
jgi:hypothetical protein